MESGGDLEVQLLAIGLSSPPLIPGRTFSPVNIDQLPDQWKCYSPLLYTTALMVTKG